MTNPKEKLKPDIASDLMKIFGTEKGEKKFPGDQYWKKNEDGQPTFNWKDLVSRYEMKSYFGRLQQEKKKKASEKAKKSAQRKKRTQSAKVKK